MGMLFRGSIDVGKVKSNHLPGAVCYIKVYSAHWSHDNERDFVPGCKNCCVICANLACIFSESNLQRTQKAYFVGRVTISGYSVCTNR
jgi:hypothetical protein